MKMKIDRIPTESARQLLITVGPGHTQARSPLSAREIAVGLSGAEQCGSDSYITSSSITDFFSGQAHR